jgi:hypothetical protein
MDRVLKPVWTDDERTEGTLTFIPHNERTLGHRSHRGLEDNLTHGRFKAHPALQQALNVPEPMTLEDDLADRINEIAITQSENGNLESASTRTFRQAMFSKFYQLPTPPLQHPPVVAPHPPLTPAFWNTFWKYTIPHNARNVWWRLLINKLPSGLFLNSILPDMVDSPLCRVCQVHLETSRHRPFSCSKKLEVWQGVRYRDMWRRESGRRSTSAASSSPVQTTSCPATVSLFFFLIGVILATVWKYHFAFVLENQTFEPRIVLVAMDLAITQARAQLAEKQRQREKQQPPPVDTNHPIFALYLLCILFYV